MNLTAMSKFLGRLPRCTSQPSFYKAYMSQSRFAVVSDAVENEVGLGPAAPSKWHGLWEPDDLKFEPDIPEFKALHIRMRGYDYPTLEAYARYVHKAVKIMFNLESDAWASPAKLTQARTYHPKSTNVNQKYDLQKFERTVLAENVQTTTVPILLQFIQKNCPQGVEVSLKEPDSEEEEFRYVPDYGILELQTEKEAIASGKLRKK